MQNAIRRAIAAAVLAVVPAGLAACGDDDDVPATTELSIPTGAATSASTTSTTSSADTTSSTRAPRDVQPTSTKPMQTTMVTEASGATLGVASTTTALGRS